MKYLIKQMDWDLIENFNDRSSKEFNDYFKMTSAGSTELTKKNDRWFTVCDGYVEGETMWDAFKNGNIGERTFKGCSISTGDVLVDEQGKEFVLTDFDFELVA